MSTLRLLLSVLAACVIFIAGGIAHERDIARNCAKHGSSMSSTWTIDLVCRPATQTGGGQ